MNNANLGVGFPSEKFSPKLTVQWRDTRPPDIDTDGSWNWVSMPLKLDARREGNVAKSR